MLNRNRIVLGQIVGAGQLRHRPHRASALNGGGIASLGVVGGDSKARGCTGLPTPVGDFYRRRLRGARDGPPVRRQPHLQRHAAQLLGRQPQRARTSVEPGSGSSIMAYAGICRQDNLQPHSDPYCSQRSYDEITTYTSRERPPINEVQTVSLRDFDTNGDSFTLGYNGRAIRRRSCAAHNYTTAGHHGGARGDHAGAARPSPSQPSAGRARAAARHRLPGRRSAARSPVTATIESLVVTGTGATGFVGETVRGGPVDNRGFTSRRPATTPRR